MKLLIFTDGSPIDCQIGTGGRDGSKYENLLLEEWARILRTAVPGGSPDLRIFAPISFSIYYSIESADFAGSCGVLSMSVLPPFALVISFSFDRKYGLSMLAPP